jgi:hypothetical protein
MAQKNRANMLTDIVSNIYNNLINFITGQNAQDRFVNLLDSSPNILSDASQPNGYVSTDANNEMFSSYYDEEISRADLITDLTANLAVGGKFYRINDAVGATITLLVIAESNVNLYSIGTDIATGEQGTYDITTDVFTPIVVSGTPDLQQVTDVGFTTTNKLKSDNGAGGVSSLNGGTIDLTTGGATVNINASLVTTTYNAQLPDKLTSPQTFAMLSDITSGGGIPHATAAGVDTYTATVSGVASYTDGDAYLVRFTNGNTTSATLNINSLGAKSLYRNNDGAIIGGDIWDGGEMLCVFNTTLDAFQCIGTSPNSIFAYVTNDDSVSITKGQVVYAFGGTGDRMTVKLANNTSDATSARTVGVVLSTSIAANQKGIIILQGLLDGLSILPTSTYADGDSIYLGATAGSITNVKQYAPNHLVYVATVTTASNGSAGRMYVRVQNGYELDELHNVQAQSPTLNDTLYYDNLVSPPQWKTASIATILGYTPMTNPMTTGGDVIYGGASGVPTRLANGSAGQILQSNGTTLAPSWVAAPSGTNTYAFNVISQTLVAPADATSYLFGLTVEIPASANLRREFKFPQAGTMTAFSFNLLQSTNGSNETCTLYLRNTSTSTDYTIGTFTSDFGPNGALKTLYSGLSIAVNTTDNWVVKILTPTWGTNPANWIPVGIITITT